MRQRQIVTPFGVGTYPYKNFATFRTVRVRPVYGASILSFAEANHLLTSSTEAGAAPILHLTILQKPVFLINSRLGLFTAAGLAASTPSPEVTGSFCRVP